MADGTRPRGTRRRGGTPMRALRRTYNRVPTWALALLFILSTLLILVLTGVELPEVA